MFKYKRETLQTGSSILTSINDIKERLQILVGEITSGNTNKTLKNELAEILNYLLKPKHINKSTYSRFINLVK